MDIGRLTATLGVRLEGFEDAIKAMTELQKKSLEATTMINQKLEDLEKSLKSVKREASAAGAKLPSAFNLDKVDKFNVGIAATAQRLRTIGYLMGGIVTTSITMAGRKIMNVSKEFEYAIRKIEGLSGLSTGAVDDLRDSVLQLSPQVAKTPLALAESLQIIADRGYEGAQAMLILEKAAKASVAGLGEMDRIADVAMTALHHFNKEGLDVSRIFDILTASAHEGGGGIENLGNAFATVAPKAKQLGVTFESLMSAVSAITATGVSAQQAQSYLRGYFEVLTRESTEGSRVLDMLGLSYEKLRKTVASSSTGLLDSMKMIDDAVSRLEGGEKILSQIIPNFRAVTAELLLTGANLRMTSDVMQKIANSSGLLNKAFSAVSDTVKVRFDAAVSDLQVSLIKLGEAMSPMILDLLQRLIKLLNDVTKRWEEMSDAQKKNILNIAKWTAAAGPLLLVTSSLMYAVHGVFGAILNVVKVGIQLGSTYALVTKATTTATGAIVASTTAVKAATFSWVAFGTALMGVIGIFAIFAVKYREMILKIQQNKIILDSYRDTLSFDYGATAKGKLEKQIRATFGVVEVFGAEKTWGPIAEKLTDRQLDNMMIALDHYINQLEDAQDKLTTGTTDAVLEAKKLEERRRRSFEYWDRESEGGTKGAMNIKYYESAKKLYDQQKLNTQSIIEYEKIEGATVTKSLEKNRALANVLKQQWAERLKLTDTTELEKLANEDVLKILAKMRATLEGLEGMKAVRDGLLIPFDLAKEKAQVLLDTIDKLLTGGFDIKFDDFVIQDLLSQIKELGVDFSGLTETLKKFSSEAESSFAGIALKARLMPKFDKEEAELAVYKKLVDDFIGVITAPDPYTGLPPVVTDEQITQLENYIKTVEDLEELMQRREDEKLLRFLSAQTMAFGGQENALKLLNAQLNILERKLRVIGEEEGFSERFQQMAKLVNDVRQRIKDLEDAIELTFAVEFHNSIRTARSHMAMLDSQIYVLTNRMRDLSVAGKGGGIEFESYAKQIKNLETFRDSVDALRQSLIELFMVTKDDFQNFGEFIENWAKGLLRAFQRIAAERLVDAILGALLPANNALLNSTKELSQAKQQEALMTYLAATAKSADTIATATNAAVNETAAASSYTQATAKSIEAKASATAEGAKMPFPLTPVAIALNMAAVLAALGMPLPTFSKMKEGGVVPPGYPDDTYPALLTSGEIVVPPSRAIEYARNILLEKNRTRPFAKEIAAMAHGGVVPPGYPNDTYPALLSSGEIVLPTDWAKTPPTIKIVDARVQDAITGERVSDRARKHAEYNTKFIEKVVRGALERNIDPYTALAIPLQETGEMADIAANPFKVFNVDDKYLGKFYEDNILGALDILAAKMELAVKLGYESFDHLVQAYNGMGKLTEESFGINKAYGITIPPEGISMKEQPLYGQRIQDLRNNVLAQNEELVRFIESIMKEYPLPTLPVEMFQKPIEYESLIPTDVEENLLRITEAFRELSSVLYTTGLATQTVEAGVEAQDAGEKAQKGRTQSLELATSQGLANITQTAMTGGNIGKSIVQSIPAMIGPLLSFIPGIGPLAAMLLGGVGGGLFSGIASKFASGGVVPPGYPNDTYPALLSSGEVVLPKNISTTVAGIENREQRIHITVDGKISNKDLMLALRRANVTN